MQTNKVPSAPGLIHCLIDVTVDTVRFLTAYLRCSSVLSWARLFDQPVSLMKLPQTESQCIGSVVCECNDTYPAAGLTCLRRFSITRISTHIETTSLECIRLENLGLYLLR